MTRDKDFKRHIRERMARTGERYTTARRQLLTAEAASDAGSGGNEADSRGINPATTAFRLLLQSSARKASEGDLLIAGGGLGIGVFSFHYEDFSSLFLAGRHLWHDDLAFIQGLADRLDVRLEVRETGSRKRAERDLHEITEEGPVAAFVDLATLGHRGSLEAYYLVVVQELDEKRGVALVADLADELIEVPLNVLADARARHRKFKNRLVRITAVPAQLPLVAARAAGLRACASGLVESPMKGFGSNFTLDGLDLLVARMRGDGKESWRQNFPPGPRLWTALGSIYEYVEQYGSGGGLLRPFFAESLGTADEESGAACDRMASAYRELGEKWSALAGDALTPEVPEFGELARLIDQTYGIYDALGPSARDELAVLHGQRRQLVTGNFPLDPADADRHVGGLADRLEELAAGEREAAELLESLSA